MTSTEPLAEYLEEACEAVRRAAVVLEDWRRRFQIHEKGRFDLVTDADLNSQRVIRDHLLGRFPGHQFLGEEDQTPHVHAGPDAPPTWIVDPIDGTSNYVHDCPLYCISIGLQVQGELVVGVILDPTRNELFTAAKGRGAWLGSERLQTSRVAELKHALVGTGFAYDFQGQEQAFPWFRYFSQRTLALRRIGSTALNLAYLAAGRFDAFYAFDNKVWDLAAGVVLVREAGGTVTNIQSDAVYDPFRPDALASNGPLHSLLEEGFRQGP